MNIILFEEHEINKPLPRRDERTIHLLKVLHKQPGDYFEAGLLGDKLGTGLIESIRFDGSLVFSLDLKNEPPARYPLRLAVGFPRPIQLRRILRDISSLGAEAVDLVCTDLGERSYRDTKMLKDGSIHTAMKEGAIQARDTRLPVFSVYSSLDSWLRKRPWDEAKTEKPLLGFSKTPPLLVAADNIRPEGSFVNIGVKFQSMVIALGSERGWSDDERDKLENAGFLRLSIGERALKTDTACVAAAILALEKMGALG